MKAPFPWFGGKRKVATEVLWFSPHCLSGQMPTLFGIDDEGDVA